MPTIYGAIDLAKNELRNAVVQNLGSAPASPVKGQIYFDTGTNILYWCQNPVGPVWIAAMSGSSLNPATTVTTQAVGDATVVGTSANYAREDHKHGREAFGVVTAETAFGSASGNGAAATVTRSDHTHGNPVHDAAAHAAIPVTALAAATSFLDMGNHVISNMSDPLAPQDAASKNYVDNAINGLSWKDLVWAATTANIVLSGTQTVDGQALVQGHRVLVKNQTDATQNGLYTVRSTAWTRTNDADSSTELEGMAVYVDSGTVNGDTSWVLTTPGQGGAGIVIGTTPLTYVQFAGPGTVVGGAGMTQSGNTLNVIAGDTSITVAADDIRVNTSVIVPTTRSVIAGAGLTGGGTLAADATLNVIAGDTSLVVNADELHVNTAVMATVASLASYQPLDSDLTALAALATTGLQARTGTGTQATRSVVGTTPVSVTNGDGVAGNPTVAVAQFGAATAGVVPQTGGASTTFLRADGAWASPPGSGLSKFAAALTGTASPETVTHNLNTRDVQVTVLNGATPYTAVEVDWDAATVNTVTIRYTPNLGAGYRVVVVG